MKYIFSLFLVIIFLTEHFSPLTKTTDVVIKMIDNENEICYNACDIDPLITEPVKRKLNGSKIMDPGILIICRTKPAPLFNMLS